MKLGSAAAALIEQWDMSHSLSPKRIEALRVALKRAHWEGLWVWIIGFLTGVAAAWFGIGYALYLNAPL